MEKLLIVTPYAGVWIEICMYSLVLFISLVTPYAGVWIEMRMEFGGYLLKSSLPTRECGLK